LKKVLEGNSEEALASSQRIYHKDLEKIEIDFPSEMSSLISGGSILYVPIVTEGKPVGVLGLLSNEKARFTAEDISILNHCAAMIGLYYSNLLKDDPLSKSSNEATILAAIARENPFPILRMNHTGSLIYANQAGKEMFKKLNMQYGDLPGGIFEEACKIALDNNQPYEIEYPSDHNLYSLVFVPTGNNKYVNAYGKDITYRKSVEDELRRLSLIAREIESGIVITDAEGKTEWVNPVFERMTGYSMEEMKGKIPGDLLQGPETDKETVDSIRSALKKRIPIEADILNY
jgi:PAS domain-containing protein